MARLAMPPGNHLEIHSEGVASATIQVGQPTSLVVDLDSTLLKTDLLVESVIALLRKNCAYIFMLPVWLLKGKAYLKQEIARRASLDISDLPYRNDFRLSAGAT
jgi:hypothetical protein